jgi:ABC-2 type transport system ATP-binding protein
MIEVIDCSKRYGELTAVDDLTLKVGSSEIFGLLGPNGAGKSTTIKMMVGLLKPDSGLIKIGGDDISLDPVSAKRSLAYIPEKSHIFNKLTAWEYITFIGGLYGLREDTFRDNAEEYLKKFELFNWKDELISNFSMGMRQRLLLISSFMRRPKVVILDEPHNGLDPKGIRLLKDCMLRMRDEGTSILLSTHVIAIAEELCDNIAIINKGSIAAQGSSDNLKDYAQSDDKTLEDIFLRLTSDYKL